MNVSTLSVILNSSEKANVENHFIPTYYDSRALITYQVEKNKNYLIHWPSGTTSGSNSSLGSFYLIYLGPEIKNLEETPYYG